MKYIISLMIVFVLSNCEVKVKESNAYDSGTYDIHHTTIRGMDYVIISSSRVSPDAGVTVVNLTKDSLEVEYYKKMLKQ